MIQRFHAAVVARKRADGGAPVDPYASVNFIDEDFEGDDLPAGWGASSVPVLHSTSSPLAGAKSLLLNGSGDAANVSLNNSGNEVTIDMLVSYGTSGGNALFYVFDSSFTQLARIFLVGDGTLVCDNSGGLFTITTGATSANTPFYLRIHYKKGTGSNAEIEIFWSLTTTFPARGSANYAGVTNGTTTTAPFLLGIASVGSVLQVDDLRITSDSLRRVVVCDGDSITAGSEPTDSWPIQLQASIGSTYRVLNVAVSGQTLDSMIADANGQYLRYATPLWNRTAKPVLIVWEVYNQAGSSTAAQIETKTWTLCDAGKAAGFYVIVCADFHNNTLNPGGIGTICQATNALLRANYGTHADALAELDLQSLRDDADANDDVHLTTTGWAIVAGIIDDLVLAVP